MWLNFLLISYLALDAIQRCSSEEHWNRGEHDFIVVGAGGAGCIVAARLAASGNYSVLLLETGGYPHPEMEIPALSTNYYEDTNYVKIHPSIPQKDAAQVNNGIVNLVRAQMLGGTASLNAMVLNRGSPEDYNNWARLVQDDSWRYSKLLKYFRKFETYVGPLADNSNQRGFHGPITVSHPSYAPGQKQWLDGGKELQFNISGPNAPQQIGFSWMEYSQHRGRRMNSYLGYIKPMLEANSLKSTNGNLHVVINSEVTKIVIENGTAVGVEFITETGTHLPKRETHARALKEVIICAGTVGSPLLLMKSGIGIRADLKAANISVIQDLPVGHNLQDHLFISLPVILANSSAAFDPSRDLTEQTYQEYLETGDGPYTASGGHTGQAFFNSNNFKFSKNTLQWPDLHLMMVHRTGKVLFTGFSQDISHELDKNEVSVKWVVSLARTNTSGQIKLNHGNISADPIIDFNYLSNPNDYKIMVKGLRLARSLCENTRAFKSIGCRIPEQPLEQCKKFEYPSHDYWRCFTRQLSNTGFHYSGTCRMGKSSDQRTVVDSELKVLGIQGLRVADASIMPEIVNVNTQGAVYVIAEKAADMILDEWESI